MYIPTTNIATDKAEIVDFMKRFSFATIITSKDNLPTATHLPFVVSHNGENIMLTSHFAKANDQWKDIEENPALVIFSEPHAYISTSNYDKELNVPTWNYIAVHAYGKARLITDQDETFDVLGKTIQFYENSYQQQWDSFPADYKLRMSKGIVAFEILITDLQAKKKLSQNRSETEKNKIIDTLSNSKDSNEQVIAAYMRADQTQQKEI